MDELKYDRVKLLAHAVLLAVLAGGNFILGLRLGTRLGNPTLGGLVLVLGAMPLVLRALHKLVLAMHSAPAIDLRHDGIVLRYALVTKRVLWDTVTYAETDLRPGLLGGTRLILRRTLVGALRGGTITFPLYFVALHRSRYHELVARIARLREAAPAARDAHAMQARGAPMRADPETGAPSFDADAVIARYLEQKRAQEAVLASAAMAPSARPRAGFGRKGL